MRYLLVIALVFAFVGIANADSVPTVTDPKNYPSVWTRSVYNGSNADIESAQVVRWDCGVVDQDAGYDDMCMWVEETDDDGGTGTEKVAGVVPYGRILAAGAMGEIIVNGPAIVWCTAGACTDIYTVTDDGSGGVKDEAVGDGAHDWALGYCIDNNAGTEYTDLSNQYAIIFVHIGPLGD